MLECVGWDAARLERLPTFVRGCGGSTYRAHREAADQDRGDADLSLLDSLGERCLLGPGAVRAELLRGVDPSLVEVGAALTARTDDEGRVSLEVPAGVCEVSARPLTLARSASTHGPCQP